MTDVVKAPPAAYWNGIRQHEVILYERGNAIAPLVFAVEAVELWRSGAGNGTDAFGLTAYYAQTPIRNWRPRNATLATFDEPEIPEEERTVMAEARIFELKLKPGQEDLVVYAAWLPLTWYGLNPDGAKAQKKGRNMYRKSKMTAPSEADFTFVREQFQLGASGVDRIKLPGEY